VFLKSANWIPAHSFVASLGRADYERNLCAATAANMNAIRVWGGCI
jgi:beta-mannosidase